MKDNKLNLKAGHDYISNNSASTFRSCPRKFHLEYNEKVRSIHENVSLYFGKAIHQALDYYFKECQDSDLAVEYFCSVFDGEINEKPIMWSVNSTRKDGGDFKDAETARNYGCNMLSKYFDYWFDENQKIKVLASEIDFEFDLVTKEGSYEDDVMDEDGEACRGSDKTIKYSGIIDQICEIDGKIYVRDFKTVAQKYSKEFIDNDYALTGYILGAEKLGYKVEGVIYDYLIKTKEPRFDRVPSVRTKEQIEDFKEDTIDTVKAIQSGVKYRSVSKDICSWCKFQKYCSRDEQAKNLYYIEK